MANSRNSPNSQRRLVALRRRRMAIQLRLAGRSEEEIAEYIYRYEKTHAEKPDEVKKITQQRVSQLITEARAHLKTLTDMDAADYIAMQTADIGQALLILREGMASKDPGERYAAADRIVRQWKRLSELLGLDAPVKTQMEVEQKTEYIVTWGDFADEDGDGDTDNPA